MAKHTTHKLIAIDSIEVADRLRDDYGDVLGLAEDIKRNGLLHGIVVEETGDTSAATFYRLLAGERRLRACRSLGWKEVQAKVYSGLTDEERLDIEVSENTKRKGLTEGELAKRLNLVNKADGIMRHAGEIPVKRGRPSKRSASTAKIAEKAGMSKSGVERAAAHAEAIRVFPELASLSQRAALKEYKKRIAPPKKQKPEPAPKVVAVPEFKLSGAAYERIATLVREHGYLTPSRAVESALELLLNTVTTPEKAASPKPTIQPRLLSRAGRQPLLRPSEKRG